MIFNMNSQQFLPNSVPRTTSYVVEIYQRPNDVKIAIGAPGSRVYCFVGDTFFGRGLANIVGDQCRPKIAERDRGRDKSLPAFRQF